MKTPMEIVDAMLLEKVKKSRRKKSREYAKRHPERVKARKTKWRLNNLERVAETTRQSALRRNFNLTQVQWEELFTAQGNLCAICRTDQPGGGHFWSTDHDHKTKMVRGILCHHCNLILGHAKDNPATLLAAIAYLRK